MFLNFHRDLSDVRQFVRTISDLLASRPTDEMINRVSGTAVPRDGIVTHIAALLGDEPHRVHLDRTRSTRYRRTSCEFAAQGEADWS